MTNNGDTGYTSIAGVLLPKKATAAMVVCVITACISGTAFVLKIDQRLSRIEDGMSDRWSRTDMLIWVDKMRDRNEGKITVPLVQEHLNVRQQ